MNHDVVLLPNGKTIGGVPSGATDEEIKQEAIRMGIATESDFPSKQPEAPVDFDVGTMVSNIPASAGKFATDIATPFMEPVDTAVGLFNAIRGGMQKLTPGIQEQEKYADAIGEFFKERYGSMDAFKKTAMEDPVGLAGDLASFLTLGSAAIPKVGGTVAKVASAIDPLNVMVKAPVKAISNIPGVKQLPEKLYQSAAKFGTTVRPSDRARMTETALDNKILPTIEGVDKANDLITNFNNQIDTMIDASTSKGKRIPRKAMYSNLKELRRELGGFTLEGGDNIKRIDGVVRKFENYIKGKKSDFVTPREVQDFKKKIYKSLEYKKKQGKGSQAAAEAKKAIARSAKESLEQTYPELKSLNAQEGAMIELRDAIERSANRIDNRDLLGIGVPIKAAAGAAAGGVKGAAGGVAIGLLDNPTVKAKLALAIRKAQELELNKRGALSTGLEIDRQIGRLPLDEQANQ